MAQPSRAAEGSGSGAVLDYPHVVLGTGNRVQATQKTIRGLLRSGHIEGVRFQDVAAFRTSLRHFYAQRQYLPAWLTGDEPTTQAREIIEVFAQANTEGLRAADYDLTHWRDRLVTLQRPHSVTDNARFDIALTVSTMRYLSDLRTGRVDPRALKFGLNSVGGRKLDLAGFTERLASANNVQVEVQKAEPPYGEYRELRNALIKYTRIASEDSGEQLPLPAGLGYPGPPYPGYRRLVVLLQRLGDLPQSYVMNPAGLAYDPPLLQAVRHYQARHGISPTGYLNRETVDELNIPLGQRVGQIRLAMERYRWLNQDAPHPAIVVNIPGFDLHAIDANGNVTLRMKVDVGDDEEDNRTPVLQSSMEAVIFRPSWWVPLPIQREEFVPFLAQHPDFLVSRHFQVVTRSGQLAPTRLTKQELQDLRTGKLRLRQLPGPDNPMGLVKFMFPNRYSVYLHDVPDWDYGFVLPTRLVSHGCVHLEKPAELAAWVLRNQPGWTLQRVKDAMQRGRNDATVRLAKPIPVLIYYTTVSPGEDGAMNFYRDIYGYDAQLSQALDRDHPNPK